MILDEDVVGVGDGGLVERNVDITESWEPSGLRTYVRNFFLYRQRGELTIYCSPGHAQRRMGMGYR